MRCPGTMHVPDGGGILLMCDTCGRRNFILAGERCAFDVLPKDMTPEQFETWARDLADRARAHREREKPDRRTLPVLLTATRVWARNVRLPALSRGDWIAIAACVTAIGLVLVVEWAMGL